MSDSQAASRFVYVTYIRTTPEKLWHALTDPAMNRQYWFNATQVSEWKKGASWKILFSDGRVADSGEILECDPPKKLAIKWRNEFKDDLKAEGYSTMTATLEAVKNQVKLTIVHEIDVPESKLIGAVSTGWPAILSSLKSLLETGTALEARS